MSHCLNLQKIIKEIPLIGAAKLGCKVNTTLEMKQDMSSMLGPEGLFDSRLESTIRALPCGNYNFILTETMTNATEAVINF